MGDIMKNRDDNKKRGRLFLLHALLILLLVPLTSHALTYDFNGTVLYDNQASSTFRPGLGDSFNGSLLLEDNGSLSFYNRSAGTTTYNKPGSMITGHFNDDISDFFFAYSEDEQKTHQMGVIWWSNPRQIKIQGSPFTNVTGLAFYVDNYNYTPAYSIAQSINEYISKGNLKGLLESIHNPQYSGCQVKSGNAFLGLLTEPLVPHAKTPSAAAVPLPTSILFLGSGLALLWRRKK